jgi:hypothetical protein
MWAVGMCKSIAIEKQFETFGTMEHSLIMG